MFIVNFKLLNSVCILLDLDQAAEKQTDDGENYQADSTLEEASKIETTAENVSVHGDLNTTSSRKSSQAQIDKSSDDTNAQNPTENNSGLSFSY